MSPYCIAVFVPTRLFAFHVTIMHYSVCASKAVCTSCLLIALHSLCQEGCLQFMSTYCITECVPARLSTFHDIILLYNLCASKSVCSSCHHTSFQCVCHQGYLQFMSPYCITECVPTRLSAFHVTILHYSLCASQAACSSCHRTALQCVCREGCLQFMLPYCITECVPAILSSVHFTILHYILNANKAVCSSCHHAALQCVCQEVCLHFMSPYCFAMCVPARLSAVRVTILHYILYANMAFCSTCHHIAFQCV